jgi:hypothetical protein
MFCGQSAQESSWVRLFDGKTLSGFRAAESPSSFSVRDGVIVVKGPRGHLFYEGQSGSETFENFHFECEVKTHKGANSGVFIHSAFQEQGWPEVGYEIQVNNSHSDTIRTGSVYGVVKVSEAPASDDSWFHLEVLVRRKNVCVKVDGKVLVNWNEPLATSGKRKLSQGTFALQAHDPESEVHYKNLRVRRLPDSDRATTRSDRQLLKPEGDWWDRMDYGPFLSATLGLEKGNTMLKSIVVPLGATESHHYAFDTELLRSAFWDGPLRKSGVTYDGSHGGHPITIRRDSSLITQNCRKNTATD